MFDMHTDEIPISLVISFGQKQYNKKNKEAIEELKNAGISFQIFSKKLEGNENIVKPASIKNMNNKLEQFFKKDGKKSVKWFIY